jgi:hypothetical protein
MSKNESKSASAPKAGDKSTEAAGSMPLFYTKPTPLDSKKHATLGLKKNFGFGFASTINAVPINMIEMTQICHHYPIAFSPDASATPVAIVGLRDMENLFVQPDGRWAEATYIPSYVRRYPFIFSEVPGGDGNLTLCVDMNDNVVADKSDQPFFEADGKPSTLSKNGLEFCKAYHAAAKQTQDFSAALVKYDLLTERAAQINVAGNTRINFSGFRILDEQKLEKMKDKDFLEFRKTIEGKKLNWVPFLYAALFSGPQWHKLTYMLNNRMDKNAA